MTAGFMLPSVFSCENKNMDFKISLAEWSLHRMLFSGKLDHLDFCLFAKKQFDINAVEYVNSFFFDKAEDVSYLKEMKKRADDIGVISLIIMCDNEGALGDPDKKARNKAVENHYKWMEAARYLGCHSIRVNARSEGNYVDQIALAADGLRKLTEYGEKIEINTIVENHGGLSSNGKWLVSVMNEVNHPMCGTLPDFGNFKIKDDEWYDRYLGVKELMPFAKAVSAKSHSFDSKGNEIHTDFNKMVDIVLSAGYDGYIGIEYEGSELEEVDGIMMTKSLMERVGLSKS